mgnify:CR=1 FL=1
MEKDAEILSVGKIAESARFAEEEDLSLKTDFVSSSEASYGWLPSVAFVERHRGQVPLNFDKGGFNVRRFATRALACGERVRYPTIFPKSLIRYLMTGDGIVANRGLIEMLESLFALADYRPSLSTLTFEGGDLHWRLLH